MSNSPEMGHRHSTFTISPVTARDHYWVTLVTAGRFLMVAFTIPPSKVLNRFYDLVSKLISKVHKAQYKI